MKQSAIQINVLTIDPISRLQNTSFFIPQSTHSIKTNTVYKRVAQKIKPVPGIFPEDTQVKQYLPDSVLDDLSPLPTRPSSFVPGL